MKRLGLALWVVCALACKKSPEAGSGSAAGSTGSMQAGSMATPGSGSSAIGGSAAASSFDDKLVLPEQPARPKDEQARVDGAADALRVALTAAKTASDSATLCKAFGPLEDAMTHLQRVTAPAGNEQAFSSQRDNLLQSFDEAGIYCRTPANVRVDMLRDLLSDIRKQFVELVGTGAK